MAQFQLTVNVLDSFTKKQPLTDAEVIAIEYYKGNQASTIEAEVIEADKELKEIGANISMRKPINDLAKAFQATLNSLRLKGDHSEATQTKLLNVVADGLADYQAHCADVSLRIPKDISIEILSPSAKAIVESIRKAKVA